MGMVPFTRRLAACTLATLLPGAVMYGIAPAHAQPLSDGTGQGDTQVRLLAGGPERDALTGGIEIRLPEGWKTYWRYPGDSGIPPHFDWTGSENVESIEILWPAPVRFEDGGSSSIGYKSDVVIPFRVVPQDANKPVDLQLDIDFAVCSKICQPANASLALNLPSQGAPSTPPALSAALAAVPRNTTIGAQGTPRIEAARLEDTQEGPAIRVEAKVSDAGTADLFVEGPSEEWNLPLPQREIDADGRAVFILPVDGLPKGADITAARLRFTLVDAGSAVEVDTPLSTR